VVPATSAVTSSQRVARGADRSSLPTMPLPPAPASSGCVPGATPGGSSQQHDQAADRIVVCAWVPAEAPTCTAVQESAVPGPSVLPGFSPE
jgi:hypothetical protein